MWKNEFKRLFSNKTTVIVIILLIMLGFISFYVSYQNKSLYVEQYNKGSIDMDKEKMGQLIDDYNGLKFNLDFYTTSDFIQIYIIVIFIFVGIFMSPALQKFIENGQENFILCRASYKKHSKNLFIAQSLYIATIILISFLIITITGFIVGGSGSGMTSIGFYNFELSSGILLIIFQYLIITLLTILVNGICLFSNVFIKTNLLIQCFPLAIFLIVPLIISSSIGNIFSSIGIFTALFIPFNIIYSSYFILQSQSPNSMVISTIFPYITYLLIFVIVFTINRRVFSKDCL